MWMGYCNCSLIGNLLWFYCAVHGIPLPYLFDDCIEFWWKIDALIDNNKVLWFSTTMKSHKWKDQTLFSGRCHNNRKSTNRLCSKWSQANFLFVELRNSNEDNLRTHRAYNVAALHTWKKTQKKSSMLSNRRDMFLHLPSGSTRDNDLFETCAQIQNIYLVAASNAATLKKHTSQYNQCHERISGHIFDWNDDWSAMT